MAFSHSCVKQCCYYTYNKYKLNIVKNLFGIQDVFLQVLLTRLTPNIKTLLFLKLTNADKNWLTAFHTWWWRKLFLHLQNAQRCKLTLIHFCRYQLTVVAIQMLLIGDQFVKAVLMLGWKPNVLWIIIDLTWSLYYKTFYDRN